MAAASLLVLHDPAFPYDGARPDDAALAALTAAGAVVVDADGLAGALAGGAGALVNLHGPYVPVAAWDALLAHLRGGGGLVTAGGAPFTVPVRRDGDAWRVEGRKTAYHRRLLVHEALPLDGARIDHLAADGDLPLLAGREDLFEAQDTFGLVLHVTRQDDAPGENGSAGPMDAFIRPLLRGVSADGREVAAPVVLLEHVKGDYAGGRWVMVNQPLTASFWAGDGAALLAELAAFTASGVTEWWLKPTLASFEPGERASLTLQAQAIGAAAAADWTFTVKVTKDDVVVWEHEGTLTVGRNLAFARLQVPVDVEPGQYRVECVVESDQPGSRRVLRQGWWGMDRALLEAGTPLTAGRDYLERDGVPVPVVGMTYMTSDVARKFLQLPNVDVWDRDMAEMARAGINLIRTGIWTAWRHVMFVDGHAQEDVLRAVDAFLLTAKKHGLEVTFNFFAFTPERFEGTNPYLDPRSVEGQKRFVDAVVARHTTTTNVHWDLINEPSMFDPAREFSGPRTLRDPFERAAWSAWLAERHGTVEALRERWDMTAEQLPSFDAAVPPEQDEMNFDVTDMGRAKNGLPWLDYVLFTMDMHTRWARELTESIRRLAPHQLVTVGQDEALWGKRPSPFFYAEAVDYTTVHSWWKNDMLVWDSVFAKDPQLPCLVQETGIMYVETPAGRAKRSEAELRNILERKYAYAFATGGAGAVQWLWNVNYFMDNVNESNIGALRADGTQKPEADVSYDFGAFIGAVGDRFVGRALEEVAVVFPYSNDFSNRPVAFEATGRLTRTLFHEMNTPFRGISEYHLDRLVGDEPRLWILPSPHNVDDDALAALLARVRASGATLLVTGPLGLDAYWSPTPRLTDVVGPTRSANVLREEVLDVDGVRYPVSFAGDGIAALVTEVRDDDVVPTLRPYDLGGGATLLWSPLPVELNERGEVLRAVYAHALEVAGVAPELEWLEGGDLPGVLGRRTAFRDGALFTFVSEYAHDARARVRDPRTGVAYAVEVPRERSVLFFTDGAGEVVATYRGVAVEVER